MKRRIWNQLIILFRNKSALDDRTIIFLTDEILKIIEKEDCLILPEGSHGIVMREEDKKQFNF